MDREAHDRGCRRHPPMRGDPMQTGCHRSRGKGPAPPQTVLLQSGRLSGLGGHEVEPRPASHWAEKQISPSKWMKDLSSKTL